MSYPQFGYSYSASSQLLVANNQASNSCCDASRPMVTDPLTGQTVCSCQYDSWTIGYSRLGTAGAIYSTSYGDQTYPSISIEPGPLYGPLANPYSIKESSGEMNGWSVSQPTSHYSYDMSAYGYGSYDLNGSRRKNATRETTSTLKAWLSEHKKNPYPTKGEKIMLAIITKMTLTQVSTWFANARRRLKKENKMTWEPKNKTSDDGDDSSDGEEEITAKKNSDGSLIDRENQNDDLDDKSSDSIGSDLTPHKILDSPHSCAQLSSNSFPPTTVTPSKPKIWSLADTATCKTPPPPPAVAPFQSSPAWVPSVGAFQVPSFSHQSSAHGSRSCGGNYAPELHASADTPPQTPPNLKVPTSGNPCHQDTSISLYTPHRNILTSMTSRFPPSTGDVSNHIPQVCAPNSLYNATDMMNTAFKPVVKRENCWT